MTGQSTPPGFYPDPENPGQQRYWDGTAWSATTSAGTPPQQAAPVGYGYAAAPAGEVAEWLPRFLARLIDTAIFFGAYIVLFILAAILGAIADVLGTLVLLVGYLGLLGGGIFYYLHFEGGPTGQTIGKKQMKIRVVDSATGQPGIGMNKAFMRLLWQFLWGIPCYYGYWSIFTNPEKITQYDKQSETRVVKA